jgi:hypothetical protein
VHGNLFVSACMMILSFTGSRAPDHQVRAMRLTSTRPCLYAIAGEGSQNW